MTLQLDTDFLISSFIWYHHVISIELPREQAKRQEMKSMLCLCTGCYFISMGTTDVAVNLIYERVTTKKATDEGVHSRRHPQFSPQPYLCLTRKESGFLMKNTLSCNCNQRSIYKHGINFHDEKQSKQKPFHTSKKGWCFVNTICKLWWSESFTSCWHFHNTFYCLHSILKTFNNVWHSHTPLLCAWKGLLS